MDIGGRDRPQEVPGGSSHPVQDADGDRTRGIAVEKEMDECIKKLKRMVSLYQKTRGLEKKSSTTPFVLEASYRAFEKALGDPTPGFSLRDLSTRWLEERRKPLGAEKERYRRKMGAELDRAFGEDDFFRSRRLRLSGNYPVLKIGLLQLAFDFPGGKTALEWGPGVERIARVPIDVDAIAGGVKDFYRSLEAGGFSEDDFIVQLRDAYMMYIARKGARGISGIEEGAPAPILEVLREMTFLRQGDRFLADPLRRNFTEYGRIRFGYDLARLRKRVIEGRFLRLIVATREMTRKKVDNLWVPGQQTGGGTHYSHILFRVEGASAGEDTIRPGRMGKKS